MDGTTHILRERVMCKTSLVLSSFVYGEGKHWMGAQMQIELDQVLNANAQKVRGIRVRMMLE